MTQYTKIIDVTPTWVDLTTEATLEEGLTYLCQNVGAKELFIFEGDSQPATTEIGVIVIKNSKQYILQKESPTKFWARINNDDVNGFSGRVVISVA
jgi:hypothetical protein